jgi:hypothetical protein
MCWTMRGNPSLTMCSCRLASNSGRRSRPALASAIGPVEHEIAERLVGPAIALHDDEPPIAKDDAVAVDIELGEILPVLLADHKALVVQVDEYDVGIGRRIALGGDADDVQSFTLSQVRGVGVGGDHGGIGRNGGEGPVNRLCVGQFGEGWWTKGTMGTVYWQ